MNHLQLVHYPKSTLKQRSRNLTQAEISNSDLLQFIHQLEATMRWANGVGIASPQVGKNIRLALVDTKDGAITVINPVILRHSLRKISGEEGCLSVPSVFGTVKRWRSVTVRYTDALGQVHTERAEGMLARVFQHEIDHLDGLLFIDRAKCLTHGSLPHA